MIHNSSDADGVSAKEMEGMAKLSTVLSTDTSKTGSMSTARAIQERTPARGVVSDKPVLEVAGDIAIIKVYTVQTVYCTVWTVYSITSCRVD